VNHEVSPPAVGTASDRLVSLDALRGFDMFWIIGGTSLVTGLVKACHGDVPKWLAEQLEHRAWHGFTGYDLIFPLFLFLAGVAMPFSLGKRIEQGTGRARLYGKIIRRGLLLVLLGLLCNGLLRLDYSHLRYPSVLGRIGLAYLFAAIIFINTKTRGRVAWLVALLVGYWAAMRWITVPGIGAGNFEPGNTLADYLDRRLLPGVLYCRVRDPEGILSTVPAIGTALLGALAGQWLRDARRGGLAKTAGLLAAGLVCLALGGLWNLTFPINKNLWSSSFVLWAGGWSFLLLGVFYLVIDVWGCRRWAFPFVVIGANAITVYVGQVFLDFAALGMLLLGHAPLPATVLTPAIAGFAIKWLTLYALYRKRVFLRL
jgi:predicted acyltransferase